MHRLLTYLLARSSLTFMYYVQCTFCSASKGKDQMKKKKKKFPGVEKEEEKETIFIAIVIRSHFFTKTALS